MLVSMVTYALSYILIRTISGYRVYAAVRGAAVLTGAPEYLMSALQKIAGTITQIPQRDLREVQAMNAFFIIPTNWRSSFGAALPHAPAASRSVSRRWRRSPVDGQGRLERPLGLGDLLFGRKKLTGPNKERLFAISTARVTLQAGAWPEADRRRGVLQAARRGEFVREENEMQELLAKVAQDSGSKLEARKRRLGYEWLIIRDRDFETSSRRCNSWERS